jgi:hypothetical protein
LPALYSCANPRIRESGAYSLSLGTERPVSGAGKSRNFIRERFRILSHSRIVRHGASRVLPHHPPPAAGGTSAERDGYTQSIYNVKHV